MSTLKQRIDELARRTVEDEDLEDVALYFFIQVAKQPDFQKSPSAEAPQLRELIEKVTEQAIGAEAAKIDKFLLRIFDSETLLHGAAYCKNHLVMFYMFGQTGQGLALISNNDINQPPIYLRLTLSSTVQCMTFPLTNEAS